MEKIISHRQYLNLLAEIDKLFEDYDANLARIEQLAHLIEKYEESSTHFAAFNQSVEGTSATQTQLNVDTSAVCRVTWPDLGKTKNRK